MKSLDAFELTSLVDWIFGLLVGSQLQDLWTDGGLLVLQFYPGQEAYLVIDLDASRPLIWLQAEKPKVKKTPKPLTLFLASHGRNLSLASLRVNLEKGRVIEGRLENSAKHCDFEIHLIPKSVNLAVRAEGKEIWWSKPRELSPTQFQKTESSERDWAQWCEEVIQFKTEGPSQKQEASRQDSKERALQKKMKALTELEVGLNSNLAERYLQLGEVLKGHEPPPDDLADLYDAKKTRSENRDFCFQKSKDLRRKKEGTLARIQILRDEIRALQERQEKGESLHPEKERSVASTLMKKSDSQGRKIQLSEGIEAVMGKSAADNLKILRSARAWDYWVHLKDVPSSHAILFRNRQQEVPLSDLEKVAHWIWNQTFRQKTLPPLRFEVLVVECRFVRPIKGDRLGRVNYQNPRVFSFASKTPS